MKGFRYILTLVAVLTMYNIKAQNSLDTTTRLTLCQGHIFIPGKANKVDTIRFKEGIAYSIQMENKPSFIFIKCGGTFDMKCNDSLQLLIKHLANRDSFDLKLTSSDKYLAGRYVKMGLTTIMYCNVASDDILYYDKLLDAIIRQLRLVKG